MGLAMLMAALCPAAVAAQDDVEADVQLDLTSKNLWRGQDYGGPALQPRMEVRWQGLYVNAEGATTFDRDDTSRMGLQLGYRAPFGLNVGVGTQWTSGIDPLNRFFFFDEKETGHRFEANLGYTHRLFSLQAYTIFGGNDFKEEGDRAFSTYVELQVPFRLGGLDWTATAAITPMESGSWRETVVYDGSTERLKQYLYGDGFTCVQACLRATKNLNLNGFCLPVYVELNTNPYAEKASLMAGISLRPFSKK